MFNLKTLFGRDKAAAALEKDQIAALLKTTPEALEAFENSYRVNILDRPSDTGSIFDVSAKQTAAGIGRMSIEARAKDLNDRIINELLSQTPVMRWDGHDFTVNTPWNALADGTPDVTLEEIQAIPEVIRPQLSGKLMKSDIPSQTAGTLLFNYKNWMEETDPDRKRTWYHMFRQGLDILDLDGLTYEILGMNRNAIGNWLPALCAAVRNQDFFKVPETTVIKVPLTLLQLSRTDYGMLTPGTMDIVNRFCFQTFGLDENRDYFIKTGTYSSKFDFRNAKVSSPKEVRELGEYLLFIQHQAQMMASPLSAPSIYGVSTTNEWAVREYIPDTENNPCIYKGMPLHTEYRIFVDLDEQSVLGMNPYWDPKVMKRRFGHGDDADSLHQMHDYVIYAAHEETLMSRYHTNAKTVRNHIQDMLPDMYRAGLTGQWSIDIMQNGNDFYIIDMALAADSALSGCVPEGLLRHEAENWLPALPNA